MRLMSFVRNKAFWLLDAIKGKPIRAAYTDIKKIDGMDSNNPFVQEYQNRAWKTLKEVACSKTKAYA